MDRSFKPRDDAAAARSIRATRRKLQNGGLADRPSAARVSPAVDGKGG